MIFPDDNLFRNPSIKKVKEENRTSIDGSNYVELFYIMFNLLDYCDTENEKWNTEEESNY